MRRLLLTLSIISAILAGCVSTESEINCVTDRLDIKLTPSQGASNPPSIFINDQPIPSLEVFHKTIKYILKKSPHVKARLFGCNEQSTKYVMNLVNLCWAPGLTQLALEGTPLLAIEVSGMVEGGVYFLLTNSKGEVDPKIIEKIRSYLFDTKIPEGEGDGLWCPYLVVMNKMEDSVFKTNLGIMGLASCAIKEDIKIVFCHFDRGDLFNPNG